MDKCVKKKGLSIILLLFIIIAFHHHTLALLDFLAYSMATISTRASFISLGGGQNVSSLCRLLILRLELLREVLWQMRGHE